MCASRRVKVAVWGLLVVLLGSGLAAAQDTTGAISGVVVDESGQLVPGADVTLVNETTGGSRSLVTNERGEFAFRAVPPGLYTTRVELAGFRTFERRNNVLNASAHLTVGNLVLAVGQVAEVVTVTATGSHVETKTSDYSGLITSKQLELIQTRGRDVMSLLRLMPGVRQEADIEAMGDSFGSQVPQVNGQRRHWNAVTVDGLLGNEMSGSARFSSAINLDAIAEVKMLLNTYKAEFGRTGGANIQIVTKSGGTDYHGNLYYYGRRDAWNANRWENNRQGLPKPKLHIDTYGFNLGGPVRIPGLWEQKNEKKLFFFYSLEAPQVQRPGPLRRYLMPTEAERRGDFSQTLDAAGRLIFIRDPLLPGACSATTGGPACFPGNIVPQNRIDRNALALVNLLPLPNRTDRAETRGQYNFVRNETSENPRWNHFLRFDWKRTDNSSLFTSLRTFSSDQTGSEITAGPSKWGFFDGAYIFSDNSITAGYTRIFSTNLINELSGGVRRQTEGFETGADADWTRIRRSDVGYSLGQLYPTLNTVNVIPRATFGLAVQAASIDSPDIQYDQRLGNTAYDWIYSVRDTLTWVKGNHTFKAGGYFEFMQNREARGGNWMGEFQFNNNVNNPLNTNFAFSNALLGVFSQYSEQDAYRISFNRGTISEWFAQDTWRATNRMTVDYGVRFLYYTPWWRPDGQSANFRPELYDPAKAPRLYVPAMVGGTRVAQDPVTGQTQPAVFIGAFVPGTGDPANGMELGTDPNVPKSFRDQLPPQTEPRLGFAYDVFGNGKTAVHASAGLFHNARLGGGQLGNIASNPPFIHNPIMFFGTMNTLLAPGASRAERPANINAFERSAKTPSSYNWSVGIQHEIGWGTAADVTYIGTAGRHLEMEANINAVPDGARFVDVHPENRDPTTGAALPAEFLRPYRGYQDIQMRGNWGNSKYNALQVQVNRRYIRGLQFALAYTYSKALGLGDEDPARVSIYRPLKEWHYGPATYSQAHVLGVSYTWDLPKASGRWDTVAARTLLDDWQISGTNSWVSGEWAQIELTTTNNFDFTGGDGGTGGGLGQQGAESGELGLRVVRPVLVGNPKLPRGQRDPINGWFNTAAFARPSRGDYGNAPRTPIQKPDITNWNLAAFKNFGLGNSRRAQFRVEAYNVLNQVQIRDIDRSARFDPAGVQVNPNFGKATVTTTPRVIQMSVRFSF